MAKDNFDNEEPEENDDNLFDEDDFGLPDLEYDELDDELDSDDDTEGIMDFALDEAEESTGSLDDVSMDLDSVDLDSVDFDAIDSFDDDDSNDLSDISADLDSDDLLDDEDDLVLETDNVELEGILEPADESDLDDDLSLESGDELEGVLGLGDDETDDLDIGGVLEEANESDLDDDFSLDGGDDMGMVFDGSDNDEGLADFEDDDFADIDETGENAYAYAGDEAEGKSKAFTPYLIIGISAVFILALVLFWVGGIFDGDDASSKKATVENKKSRRKSAEPEPKKVEITDPEITATSEGTSGSGNGNTGQTSSEDSANNNTTNEAAGKGSTSNRPVATANSVAAGTVSTLTESRNKAYIIVGSLIDGDLALDYANELAAQGKSPYVIPPFGKSLYTRVGIAEFDTFEGAASYLDDYKDEFGDDVWALRY